MTNQIVPGSLSAVSQQNGMSIAESFMSAEIVVLLDVSGSMGTNDARDNQSRYSVACQELRRLQADLPGKIAVISFSDSPQFCPSGVPIMQGGSTDLVKALQFVKMLDGAAKFFVIADGEVNDEKQTLAVAKTFISKINTIYIGSESDTYGGKAFLQKLASACGGQSAVAEKAHELAGKIEKLMLAS